MINRKQRLILTQVDKNLAPFREAAQTPVPPEGWARTVRKALNMTLAQLARRLKKTSPTVNEFEKREQDGTITLKTLQEIAEAMDMRLVYALVPKEGSLENLVLKAAEKKAKEIIDRTNTTMALEDQQNSPERLAKARLEKVSELVNEMPKFLWD